MIPLTQTVLDSMPLLWESEDHRTRLVRSDERNLEILRFVHVGGEGARGKKGEERDTWASIPCYCGSLQEAFSKLLEMHSKNFLELNPSEGESIKELSQEMKSFRKSFSETVRMGF